MVSIAPGFGQPRPNRRGEARGLHIYEIGEQALRILTYIWREDGWGLTAVRMFPRGREPLAFRKLGIRGSGCPARRSLRGRFAALRQTVARVAATGDGAVDQQQDDRADDRRQPRADVEELVERMGVEERRGEEAAEQRSDDPDDRRDDESARVVAGQQRLGDRTSE